MERLETGMLPISDTSNDEKLTVVATTDLPLSASSASSSRKPRGRPPGSKNRPKPPVIITRERESAMHTAILEISVGNDIIETVSAFSRRRRLGISILSGSGVIVNPSFHHHQAPTTHPATTITFTGRFEILSISGTFLPPPPSPLERSMIPVTVSVAGGHTQVIGGQVAGKLLAGGTVVVLASTFGNAELHRFPNQEEEEEEKDQLKVKEEGVMDGNNIIDNAGVYNVGPNNMNVPLWPNRNPRAPPPHLLCTPTSLPPPHHY